MPTLMPSGDELWPGPMNGLSPTEIGQLNLKMQGSLLVLLVVAAGTVIATDGCRLNDVLHVRLTNHTIGPWMTLFFRRASGLRKMSEQTDTKRLSVCLLVRVC